VTLRPIREFPDAAHGTNPASVTLGGYETIEVPSNERGMVDVDALRERLDDQVAGLMLTNPNTLGLFEADILEIADAVHEIGGLVYYDGANLNAIMGIAKPGLMGFDIVHSNLHKTFATPHGGGGPGAGPVAVHDHLVPFLPGPLPEVDADGVIRWVMPEKSIGRVHGKHGNFGVVLRALTYMMALGGDGLRRVSERAVLNARYLEELLRGPYDLPYDSPCMHEFVASAKTLKRDTGTRAMDIVKALMDEGFHAPTVYFPLIVEEALMIEPTETQSLQTMDALAGALLSIADTARTDPDALHAAPVQTPIGRPDEASAARNLRVSWGGDE
jgi:glycine dehydrogenase subunit 2